MSSRPFAAFELWQPLRRLANLRAGQSRLRPFDTTRRALTVAGMVRCALATAADAAHRDPAWVNTFVHGHTLDGSAQASGDGADRRFAYLPLPSITPLKVESIRRVLVLAPAGEQASLDWVRQVLSGRELFAEGQPEAVAMLSPLPNIDRNVVPYTVAARVWSTVTPVILPGRYTKGPGRAKRLMNSAFRQAGWPAELVEAAEIEWRDVSYRPGVDLASRFSVAASQADLPRYHVRIRWNVEVRGPLAIGAGRYRGMGVFAAES